VGKYTPTTAELDQIDNNFTYHAVITGQAPRYASLRMAAREYAKLLLSEVPPSRERSLALTSLENCVMWGNAGIARNEKS
jgi:hypothetical protein